MTLRQALTAATAHLARDEHLLAHAHRDAELLLLHTLQIPRVTLLAHPDRDLTPDQAALYEAALTRRLRHEPIQYITGQQEFYGLLLRVTPAVLIPRPETELLVEAVLKELKSHPQQDPQQAPQPDPQQDPQANPQNPTLQIADIGTGSGAIAIALAANLPEARITALDLSFEALRIAEANAREHNLAGRIRFLQSDLLSTLEREKPLTLFDAIVSNPPYVPDADHHSLHPEVRDHEPQSALFAGPLGLDIYRRLIPQAHAALKPNGLLALEIGHGQRDALASLLATWQNVTFIDDLQQIPRVALARKP